MIFTAQNISHLETRCNALDNCFTEGYKIVIDGQQIGAPHMSYYIDMDSFWLHHDVKLIPEDIKGELESEHIILTDDRFPLLFHLMEDDYVKANREKEYPKEHGVDAAGTAISKPHKPYWAEAPAWANWLAMDNDGQWWWFEEKPVRKEIYWGSPGKSEQASGPLDNWKNCIEMRPETILKPYQVDAIEVIKNKFKQ